MFFDVNSWYNDSILNLGGYLMSNTILRNENVSVTLKSLGGELTSIKDASGTEYLWQEILTSGADRHLSYFRSLDV